MTRRRSWWCFTISLMNIIVVVDSGITVTQSLSSLKKNSKADLDVLVTLSPPDYSYQYTHNERSKVQWTIVIDVSGSMNEEIKPGTTKLSAVISTVSHFLEDLTSDDNVELVTFADRATLARSMTQMTPENKKEFQNLIKSLSTRGGTNIEDGLKVAFKECDKYGRSVVILFTDGEANLGAKTAAEMNPLLKDSKHIVHTLGFGKEVNGEFLQHISKASGGVFKFLQTEQDITETWNFLVSNVKKVSHGCGGARATLSVKPAPNVNVAPFPSNLGDMSCGRQRDISIKLKVGKQSNTGNNVKVAEITFQYDVFDRVTNGMVTKEEKCEILLDISENTKETKSPELEVAKTRETAITKFEQTQTMIKSSANPAVSIKKATDEMQKMNSAISSNKQIVHFKYSQVLLQDIHRVLEILQDQAHSAADRIKSASNLITEIIQCHILQNCQSMVGLTEKVSFFEILQENLNWLIDMIRNEPWSAVDTIKNVIHAQKDRHFFVSGFSIGIWFTILVQYYLKGAYSNVLFGIASYVLGFITYTVVYY